MKSSKTAGSMPGVQEYLLKAISYKAWALQVARLQGSSLLAYGPGSPLLQ